MPFCTPETTASKQRVHCLLPCFPPSLRLCWVSKKHGKEGTDVVLRLHAASYLAWKYFLNIQETVVGAFQKWDCRFLVNSFCWSVKIHPMMCQKLCTITYRFSHLKRKLFSPQWWRKQHGIRQRGGGKAEEGEVSEQLGPGHTGISSLTRPSSGLRSPLSGWVRSFCVEDLHRGAECGRDLGVWCDWSSVGFTLVTPANVLRALRSVL